MSAGKTVKLLTYGFLIGTAGVAVLSSDDAKSAYTHITAAVKRCGGAIARRATIIKENCQDINADANDINEARARKKEEREIADAREKIEAYEAKKKAQAKEAAADAAADAQMA